MQEIGTDKYVSDITNSHLKRPKRMILNHMKSNSQKNKNAFNRVHLYFKSSSKLYLRVRISEEKLKTLLLLLKKLKISTFFYFSGMTTLMTSSPFTAMSPFCSAQTYAPQLTASAK